MNAMKNKMDDNTTPGKSFLDFLIFISQIVRFSGLYAWQI